MQDKRVKKIVISIILFVLAAAILAGASYAWFVIIKENNMSWLDMLVVDKAFTMGDFKVIADGEDKTENEFSGLLPGSTFRFELLVKRKVNGNINLKLEIKGITGEEFEGRDGNIYNMKELFCVAPLDSNDNIVGNEVFFSECDEDGNLLLFSSVSMPEGINELVLVFRIRFSSEKVGMENLSNVINRKKFKIGAMYVSLAQ